MAPRSGRTGAKLGVVAAYLWGPPWGLSKGSRGWPRDKMNECLARRSPGMAVWLFGPGFPKKKGVWIC